MKPYVNANELLESSLSDYDAIIIDNNNDPKNTKGSTIVDITNYKLKIVREGDIEAKQIYDTII